MALTNGYLERLIALTFDDLEKEAAFNDGFGFIDGQASERVWYAAVQEELQERIRRDIVAKPLMQITFIDEDIRAMAEAFDVPYSVALSRCHAWAKSINETATTLINEQLASVVQHNQP